MALEKTWSDPGFAPVSTPKKRGLTPVSLSNAKLTDGLTAFAMQKYYDETGYSAGYGKTLYTAVSGGLRFNFSDVASTLSGAKGMSQYVGAFFETLPALEQAALTAQLSGLNDWYFQAGATPMTATGGTRGAFMMGYNGADTLTGSTQADLILGEGGNDTLAGGRGDDTLIGGSGVDTYAINSGGALLQLDANTSVTLASDANAANEPVWRLAA